jgi:SPP1 family predicted phage head-tail adaptor
MADFRHPAAGELNRILALQARVTTPSGTGALAHAYSTIATVWCKARAPQGGRIVEGVQTEARATHLFLIRWRADQAAWRWLLFRGRRLEVRSVRDPDESRRTLEILAEEIQDA